MSEVVLPPQDVVVSAAAQSAPEEKSSFVPAPLLSQTRFVHLRAQSSYSLLESTLRTGDILAACRTMGMPAVGICDRNNLFGALEIASSFPAAGVQPIIGATLSVTLAEDSLDKTGTLALLVQNEEGYRSLLGAVSAAHLTSARADGPSLLLEKLGAGARGLICLSGGPEGMVNRLLERGERDNAAQLLQKLAAMFPDAFYVELQRYPRHKPDPNFLAPQEVEQQLVALAYEQQLPLVATNQAAFLQEEDFEAQDALSCIAQGKVMRDEQRASLSLDHGLKSPQAMADLFSDLPEALEATVEIAQRCHFCPSKREPMLPRYSEADEGEELRRNARDGLQKRLTDAPPAPNIARAAYDQRLDFELETIIKMGYAGYFLIVADFIQWAKQQGIAVGPGRGSGAGSLVAYVLGITELDPLRFGLLFERFLNPARVSMPDFDIDFCQQRRDEVIAYVQQKYGDDRVAQIITFGTLQARAVLRDVGRVMSLPYLRVDALCKMVPAVPAVAEEGFDAGEPQRSLLEQAIAAEPRLQEEQQDPDIAKLMEIAFKLEGLFRHASTHAAGVVVGSQPLAELVPLYRDPRSDLPATQFNMKWVEAAGLVKFDFLGLKTLTVLQAAERMLAEEGTACDIAKLPLADEKTFAMLSQGDTCGIFQLESAGMRDVLRQMQPDCFEDIIALVALYRPGPMDNIPLYIKRKRGEEKPDILHDSLAPVLEETYGVMIYQEQVMQIAQILSGYSLGDADLLRRAMGKKIRSEMTKQKKGFLAGAQENGIAKNQASHIFDQVNKFAGYGFNKSHAAAYALVAWQTAWLKANHLLAFYAATMSYDIYDTDRLQVICQDARAHEVEIVAPDVNVSLPLFQTQDGKLVYALSAVRNVGRKAMVELVAERDKNGKFTSVFEFARRAGSVLNRRLLEALIAAGALDSLEPNRARLFESVDLLLNEASQAVQDAASQQDNLFGGDEGVLQEPPLPAIAAWDDTEKLAREVEAIGFYFSGHPLQSVSDELQNKNVRSFAERMKGKEKKFWLAGTVMKLRQRKSKRGNPYAFLTLSDMSGEYEVVLFSETLSEAREHLEPSTLVAVHVLRDGAEGETQRLRAEFIRPLQTYLDITDAPAPAAREESRSAPPASASNEGNTGEAISNNNRRGGTPPPAPAARKGTPPPAPAAHNPPARQFRLFVDAATALADVHSALESVAGGGEAELLLVLQEDGGETELRLPGRYALSRKELQALKSISGVSHIAELS